MSRPLLARSPSKARKREPESRFTRTGVEIRPGEYGQWLAALVAEFGSVEVTSWQEPPDGWDLETWLALHRLRALESGRSLPLAVRRLREAPKNLRDRAERRCHLPDERLVAASAG